MIAGLIVALVVIEAINAFIISRLIAEVRHAQAAALQANNLPDAARRRTHAEENERAKAHLKMQQEIVKNGGVFPEPPKAKPHGI